MWRDQALGPITIFVGFEGSHLLSGFLRAEKYLHRKVSVRLLEGNWI